MTRTGSGIIAIWHDISDAGLADFTEWHNREHVPERVGIEGFQRGRRYEAVSGQPAFFTLYNVRSPDVLASPAYHARLNDPTPWTQRAVEHFSDESRSLCEIMAAETIGAGGSIGAIRFDCDPVLDERLFEHLNRTALPAAMAEPSIVSMAICRADLETSRKRSAEQAGRDDNRVPRWVILVEGSTTEAVAHVLDAQLAERVFGRLEIPQTDRSIYRLQFDLVREA